VKFYVSALVGVIIKVILQNARCNNKDNTGCFVEWGASVRRRQIPTHTAPLFVNASLAATALFSACVFEFYCNIFGTCAHIKLIIA